MAWQQSFKSFDPEFRLPPRAALARQERGCDHRLGQHFLAAHDDLMNSRSRGAQCAHMADNRQRIIELGGLAIFDAELCDGVDPLTGLKRLPLIDACHAQHVRSRALHKSQIIRVIDDTRQIGIFEINADRETVDYAVKNSGCRREANHKPRCSGCESARESPQCYSNNPLCDPAGGFRPRCFQPLALRQRPRAVRATRPSWIR